MGVSKESNMLQTQAGVACIVVLMLRLKLHAMEILSNFNAVKAAERNRGIEPATFNLGTMAADGSRLEMMSSSSSAGKLHSPILLPILVTFIGIEGTFDWMLGCT